PSAATTTTAAPTPQPTPPPPPPAPVTTLATPVTTTLTLPPVPTLPDAMLPPAHADAASLALQQIGVPYQWGGATPAGFDCSGLVAYVYAQLGITLPHSAAAQYGLGTPVSQSQLQPGDLVFFDSLAHVGIYIGGGQFVHAPHTGTFVRIQSLSDAWYASRYVGARRV